MHIDYRLRGDSDRFAIYRSLLEHQNETMLAHLALKGLFRFVVSECLTLLQQDQWKGKKFSFYRLQFSLWVSPFFTVLFYIKHNYLIACDSRVSIQKELFYVRWLHGNSLFSISTLLLEPKVHLSASCPMVQLTVYNTGVVHVRQY